MPRAPSPAARKSSSSSSRSSQSAEQPPPQSFVPPPAPPKLANQFPPSMKKGNLRFSDDRQTNKMYDIPNGIIAHLTRECGWNVHDHHVVDVTCGSREMETFGANPHSEAYKNKAMYAAKNASDLETNAIFRSAYCPKEYNITHTTNDWMC
jgi:hypothetical protein